MANPETPLVGVVISEGPYEDHTAIRTAEFFASMARVPAAVYQVARGDSEESEFTTHAGVRWAIRLAE